MKILIACDSFKGSLSSLEVAKHIQIGASRVFHDLTFETIEIADGGEGTLNAMISNIGGEIKTVDVFDPLHRHIKANFGILKDGSAVIEMAVASGLPLVGCNKNIYQASTYGTGQLIKAALDCQCKQIYIGIGGSATNDGGIGMAKALGIRFLDINSQEVKDEAYSLPLIHTIDMSKLDKRIYNTKIIVMCDVDNPLCGNNGASTIYGPQKGALPEMVTYLDQGLKNLSDVCQKCNLNNKKDIAGAGAAGGLGFGLMTFLNAQLASGIDVILQASHFNERLNDTTYVITGEGKIDYQTIHGKVPIGVAKMAKKKNKPVIAIVGCIGKDAQLVYDYGIDTIESCVYAPCSLDNALKHAGENVENATERVLRAVQIGLKTKS